MSAVDLDLDALARPPLRVKLGEKVWRLPAGPQSELVVDMAALFDEFAKALQSGEAEKMKAASDDLRGMFEDLFAEHNESIEDLPRLSDEAMAELFRLLVTQITGVIAEDGARPTQPTAAKPKSNGRSRPNSRSRRAPVSSK